MNVDRETLALDALNGAGLGAALLNTGGGCYVIHVKGAPGDDVVWVTDETYDQDAALADSDWTIGVYPNDEAPYGADGFEDARYVYVTGDVDKLVAAVQALPELLADQTA